MAEKTWTAVDLSLGPLKINRNGDNIHVERRYNFLGANGEVLEQVAGGRFVDDILIAGLPGDVAAALATIDNWTKNQALEQEEMNDT